MAAVTLIGTVARLQLQRSRLKPGPRGARAYDPSPLRQVDVLELGPRGARAVVDGVFQLDVHHADHPDSRNLRLANGVSVLPRAHYEVLRQRFGDHVLDGSAGETLLLDTAGALVEADLAGTLLLETVEGSPLRLSAATAAPPCVEFSRWCLQRGVGPVDDEVQAAMVALGGGWRGFYLRVDGIGEVAVGARLTRA